MLIVQEFYLYFQQGQEGQVPEALQTRYTARAGTRQGDRVGEMRKESTDSDTATNISVATGTTEATETGTNLEWKTPRAQRYAGVSDAGTFGLGGLSFGPESARSRRIR